MEIQLTGHRRVFELEGVVEVEQHDTPVGCIVLYTFASSGLE